MSKIFFYPNESSIIEEKFVEVLHKLKKFFKKAEIKIIEQPLINFKNIKTYSEKFVISKISNLFSEAQPEVVFKQELEFEENFLLNHIKNTQVYDAFKIQEIYKELIKYKLNESHIVFTHRIIATFDTLDKRYHSRVVLLGYPCIVSIAGLYYALSLPKQEYIKKFLNLIPQDNRKLEVEKNLDKFLSKYVIQCIIYIFFDSFFCSNRDCLHFDNHFFDEVLSQIKKIKSKSLPLCSRHKNLLSNIL